jgi:hypothetical protein
MSQWTEALDKIGCNSDSSCRTHLAVTKTDRPQLPESIRIEFMSIPPNKYKRDIESSIKALGLRERTASGQAARRITSRWA